MNIVYVSKLPPENRVGHAYKFYSTLQQRFGGTIISCGGKKKETWNQDLEELNPDLVFVPGYQSRAYKVPLSLGVPYVLTVNDVSSLRTASKSAKYLREEIEKDAAMRAAGLLFSNSILKDYFFENHLGHIPSKDRPPAEFVYLRPTASDLDFEPLPKLEGKHLVYSGIIKKKWKHRKNKAGYRAFHKIFASFMAAGWEIHVYTTPHFEKRLWPYRKMGCVVHRYVPEGRPLYQELSQYTAGLQGYNIRDVPKISLDYINYCIPNKVWEYLAAGIPTIGYNPGPGGELYNKKWGLVLKDLRKKRLRNISEHLPTIDDELRYSQTMEQDLYKFERLIEKAVKK